MRRMPYARYPVARPPYSRRRRPYSKTTMGKQVPGMQPAPQFMLQTLRYYTKKSVAALEPYQVTNAQFSLNGLYDPDIAVGGHQPLLFDQLMAIYDRYQVAEARVTFTSQEPFFAPTTSSGVASDVTWVLCIARDNTAQSNADTIMEQGGPRLSLTTNMSTPAKERKLVSPWYKISDILGIARQNYWGEDIYCGSAAANPGAPCTATIYCCASGFGSSVSKELDVTIEYKTKFSSRDQVGGS